MLERILATTLLLFATVLSTGARTSAAEPDSDVLAEILVTTTRRVESEQDIPVSITALSGEQLAQLGATQTRDLVAFAPNLSTQGSFGRTSPAFFIRGIGSTQFHPNANSKVGVYVDDVYLNSPAVHGAQLFDIERLEIARGPQGYLFGQNTTGGLIRAIARKPVIGGPFSVDAELTAGRFEERAGALALGGTLGRAAAWRAAVSGQQRDGTARNLFLGTEEGDTDVLGWRMQLLVAPASSLQLLVNVHGSDDSGELTPYKQLGLVDPLTGGPCAAPALGSGCTDYFGYADSADFHEGQWDVADQVTRVRAYGGSITLDWEAEAFSLSSVTAYEENESLINEDTDASPVDVVRGTYVGEPRQLTQELRLTSRGDGILRWIGGLYYLDEKFDGTVHFAANGFGPGLFSGIGTTPEGAGQESAMRTHSYAAFGTVDYRLTERTKLSVGLRYTHERKDLQYAAHITDTTSVDSRWLLKRGAVPAIGLFQTIDYRVKRDWDNLSGRLSLDHRLNDETLAYVSLARGFNSGNFNGGALFDQAEATLVDPEILMSYEIGIKSQPAGSKLRLNADVYYYDFKDQQVFILASGAGGSPFQQLSNAAASSLYGAELELAWKPLRGLTLQAGLGYTHSRFDEFDSPLGGDLSGNRLPSAPKTNLNLLARKEWPAFRGTIAVQADAKYTGRQFFSVNNDPLLSQGSYWLANGRVSFTTAGEHLTVALWGKNLADEDYLPGAFDLAAFGFDQWVVGEPRTYGITLSYRLR